ncbi:reverse transcriptase [Gossypium australe]|uniref:Reverse transcriptase n=1 Tax=Gossypium australe TaxID=47621 RepID=A0A5B6UQ59_9ROSI|nr:reverse transcriptase [Gossypium australe]
MKKHAFVDIKERFLRALQNWNLRLLSVGVCQDLENLMSKFWWQNSKTNKGIHWCRWRELCIPKAQGGLGFKDLEFFNLALLAKQGWKILMQPNCLFVRVMKSKYFPRGDFMSARLGSYPSFTWRSILGARHVLEEGLGWRVGNGEDISIWNDAWIPGPGHGRVQCQAVDIRFTKVADLIDKEATTWKQDVICSLFGEEQSRCILAIPLVSCRPSDVLIWRGDNTGCYTDKVGYKRIITAESPRVHNDDSTTFFTKLWAFKIPSKIRILIWKLVHNFLPTKANLNMRQLMVSPACPMCQGDVETGMEVVGSEDNREPIWKNWLVKEFNMQNTKTCKVKAIVYWALWFNRNKIHHEGVRGQVATYWHS